MHVTTDVAGFGSAALMLLHVHLCITLSLLTLLIACSLALLALTPIIVILYSPSVTCFFLFGFFSFSLPHSAEGERPYWAAVIRGPLSLSAP